MAKKYKKYEKIKPSVSVTISGKKLSGDIINEIGDSKVFSQVLKEKREIFEDGSKDIRDSLYYGDLVDGVKKCESINSDKSPELIECIFNEMNKFSAHYDQEMREAFIETYVQSLNEMKAKHDKFVKNPNYNPNDPNNSNKFVYENVDTGRFVKRKVRRIKEKEPMTVEEIISSDMKRGNGIKSSLITGDIVGSIKPYDDDVFCIVGNNLELNKNVGSMFGLNFGIKEPKNVDELRLFLEKENYRLFDMSQNWDNNDIEFPYGNIEDGFLLELGQNKFNIRKIDEFINKNKDLSYKNKKVPSIFNKGGNVVLLGSDKHDFPLIIASKSVHERPLNKEELISINKNMDNFLDNLGIDSEIVIKNGKKYLKEEKYDKICMINPEDHKGKDMLGLIDDRSIPFKLDLLRNSDDITQVRKILRKKRKK